MQKNDIEDVYPLSPMQEGMLFHSLYAPTSGIYVLQWNWVFPNLDVAAFKQSWQKVMERHAILRTAYVWKKVEKILQAVHRQVPLPWQEHDWHDMPAEAQQERLETFLQAEREQGFELSHAPLMHFTLIQLNETTYHFTWSFHHILLDGWSTSLLIKEVFAYYEALQKGHEPELPLPRPYRDYIAWLQKQDMQKAKSFWQQYLTGFETPTPLSVEKASSRKSDQEMQQHIQELHLTEETTTALHQLARRQHLTLNTLFQGAWALLLSRYSGQDDVVFGIATSGRPVALDGVEEMIGLFINTLPLRAQLKPERLLFDWLQEIQTHQLEAQQYEYSPLVQIQEWSGMPAGQPLFASLLGFENFPDIPSDYKDDDEDYQDKTALETNNTSSFAGTNYPLCVIVLPDKTLSLQIIYDHTLFEVSAIQRMLGHLQALLEGFCAHATKERSPHLRDIPMLNEKERREQLAAWNTSRTAYPADRCIHQLFEAQVEQHPQAPALLFGDVRLTYEQLNQLANQLAHYLQALQVHPGDLVGLYLERGADLIIATLAILKVRAAYVPLDLAYPKERIEFMLNDTRMRVVLTSASLWEHLDGDGANGRTLGDAPTHMPIEQELHIVALDRERNVIAQGPSTNLPCDVTSDALAYVIYTSGSTGLPKGVVVSHRAVNRLVCETDYLQITRDDRVAQASNTSFDAATFEIWGALLNGARLIGVLKNVALSPQALTSFLHEQQISILFLTTALFNQMIQEAPEGLSHLCCLLFGGETADPRHVRMLLERGCPQKLLHVYGPTENTTYSTWYLVEQVPIDATTIPIGKTIANSEVYVLDREMEPVPIGVPGELYVGGAGLALGYLYRPELTAERFVPHPFIGAELASAQPGARLYKTGDLVKPLPDGTLDFIGRRDQQVKIRGFRIELGEIEAALGKHPAIHEVIVLVREDRPGDKRLVAYVISEPQHEISSATLRTFLLQHLPDYMIPAFYMQLDALPLTPNGKVDRRALPIPESYQQGPLDEEFVAPRDPLEAQLAQIWEEQLNIRSIGIRHNFFALGGHSLHAVSLIAKIQKHTGQKLPLSILFQRPTIEQLAYALRQQSYTPSRSPIVAIQPHGTKLPFFAVHPGSGDVFCYYELARHLGFDQPLYGLEDPDLQEEDFPYVPLEVMAARYIEALRGIQPEGPYLLGGFSFGGHVAFEMAQQLRQQGQQVSFLAIFDTAVPAIVRQIPQDDASVLTTVMMEILQDATSSKSAEEMYQELQKLQPDEQFSFALAQVQQAKIELPGSSAHWLQQQVQIFRTRTQAIQNYYPKPYIGPVTLFRSTEIEEFGDIPMELLARPDHGWSEFATQLEIYRIQGHHDTIFLEPRVQILAEHLKNCLDKAQIAPQGVAL